MFARPIGNMVNRHGLHYHCYADDAQAHIVVQNPDNYQDHVGKLSPSVKKLVVHLDKHFIIDTQVTNTVKFKILLTVYHVDKSFTQAAPQYIQDLVNMHEPTCTLSSGAMVLIARSEGRTSMYGGRRSPVAAHTLWNNLYLYFRGH